MGREMASRVFMIQAKELFDAGKFSAAIMTLQEGLKQYPHFISARVLLGEIYWTSGEVGQAKVELEQVINAVPDNFAAHRKLAMIYREAGEFEQAIRSCRTVLQANPRDLEMRSLLDDLQAGPAHSGGKSAGIPMDTKRAQPESMPPIVPPRPESEMAPASRGYTAASGISSDSDAIDTETLAELYLIQGHPEKGLAVYRRLAAKHPGNPRYQERIAALEGTETKEPPHQPTEVPIPLKEQAVAEPNPRKNQVRRLEGWLQVIRDRRRV